MPRPARRTTSVADRYVRNLESTNALVTLDRHQQQAFKILTGSGLRAAFEIDDKDPELVDRYGRTLFGNSTLIARRLVERGVRFVNVTWDLFWDRIKIDYDA